MQAMPPLALPPTPAAAPPDPLIAILFSLTAALLIAGAALWGLARIGASRGKVINPPAGFVAGAVAFTVLYALNRLALARLPRTAVTADALLLAAALALPALRLGQRGLRLKAARTRRARRSPGGSPGRSGARSLKKAAKKALSAADLQLRIDVANLENMLKIDPLNTFCRERLSELYEKQGRLEQALAAAREAARQDPTVRNQWRVGELEEKLGLKER